MREKNKKRLAFCDFDGTLAKDYISMRFMDRLLEKGLYSKEAYEKQMNIYEKYKKGKMDYDRWVTDWALLLAEGLKGKEAEKVDKAAKEFYEEFRPNIYSSSYELVNLLKEKGYHTIIVSVGDKTIIKYAGKDLGFDETHATELEEKNGIYTGNITTLLHFADHKPKIVSEVAAKNNLTFDNSIGFGDSASDASMLYQAEIPIALNPNEGLRKIAEEKGWEITDHKGIISLVKKISGN